MDKAYGQSPSNPLSPFGLRSITASRADELLFEICCCSSDSLISVVSETCCKVPEGDPGLRQRLESCARAAECPILPPGAPGPHQRSTSPPAVRRSSDSARIRDLHERPQFLDSYAVFPSAQHSIAGRDATAFGNAMAPSLWNGFRGLGQRPEWR